VLQLSCSAIAQQHCYHFSTSFSSIKRSTYFPVNKKHSTNQTSTVMHLQTILLTFSAVTIAAVHSSPVPQSLASNPSNFASLTALERRDADEDLERLRIVKGTDPELERLETALNDAQEANKKANDAVSASKQEASRCLATQINTQSAFYAANYAVKQRKKELKKLALDLTPEDFQKKYQDSRDEVMYLEEK
jgi:septal ring factor EnvC (AmiA/AmiB activator)